MKSTIAKQWIAALRSGKYRQGCAKLRTISGAYCCLGVLQGSVLGLPIDPKARSLSPQAQMAAGMHSSRGRVKAADVEMRLEGIQTSFPHLARANDAGVSFAAIADWIEDNHASL